MTVDLALAPSTAYLNTFSISERRRSGAVYTPEPLVRFILDQASYTGDDYPVLDPACGAGVFFCEVVRRAAARIGDGPLSGACRRTLLRFAERNVFGIDIDPQARVLALGALRAEVQELAPGPLPTDFLARNIVEDDFLLGDAVRRLPPARRGGFAFVVGNPPYVATTRLDAKQKRLLRTLFATAIGRIDLYTLFFERGLQLLRRDGVLAYITPDKFLASQTSKQLRTFLADHGCIERIARFRSHKVFPDAAVVPCVTVISRRHAAGEVDVLSCEAPRGGDVRVASAWKAPRDELGGEPWQLRPPALLQIIDRLRAAHPSLASLSQRISAGPATGRDDVYVRPKDDFAEIEPELLRPAIRGRDITPFSIADPELRILLPFEFREGEPHLVALSRYPQARRYLERHRGDLERRHCVRVWRKPWFDLHDLPASDITHATKVVVPDVAESCRFAVDRGRFFPLHSAYYIVPHDARRADYLAAILNSTIVEFIIRLLAPVAKDGFSRFRRQFLAELPIPTADPSEQKLVIRGDDREARIARLFGVSQADLIVIEGFLAALSRGEST